MFEVKIKTLDGTNASFHVADDTTVLQFKELIADKVKIPASQQKLIYCGKVLHNDKNLKEYNVQEKVVHVVKAVNPPSSNSGGASTSRTPPNLSSAQRNGVSTVVSDVSSNLLPDVFNSMIAGTSMPQIQQNNLSRNESTQTESMRRVILIRQWIRDAHNLLDRIHDTSKNTDLTGDTQTPEAREASQTPHGQITTIEVTQRSSAGTSTASATARDVPTPASTSSPNNNSTPTTPADRQTTGSNQRGRQRRGGAAARNPDIEVLSSVWKEIDALQSRFNPFLQRYKAIVNRTGNRCVTNQHYFNIVQSVLHSISHIYHAVSDLTADVNRPGIIELQAQSAPDPPTAAIIQQTIPISIPIRLATLNVSPGAAHRTSATNRGTTSTPRTTTQSSGSVPIQQNNDGVSRTGPSPFPGTQTSQIVTDVQVDMETDESGSEGIATPPFNLQQIISDAVNGLTGLNRTQHGATSDTSTASPTVPPNTTASEANPQPAAGLFPHIPGLPDLNTLLPAAGLGPAMSLGGPLPGGASLPLPNIHPVPSSGQSARTRQDPYLMSCNSKYWQKTNHRNQQSAGQSSNRTTTPTTARTATSTSTTANTPQPVPPPMSTLPTRTSNIVYPTESAVAPDSSSSPSLDQTSQLRGEFLLSSLRRCLEQRTSNSSEAQSRLDTVLLTISEDMNTFNQTGQRPPHTVQSQLQQLRDLVPPPTERLRSMDLGLFSSLVDIIIRELTLPEALAMLQRDGRALDRLRAQLRNYLRTDVLNGGAPTNENVASAVDRLLIPISALVNQICSADTPADTDLDMSESLTSYLRENMLELFNYVVNSRADCQGFGTQLLHKLITIVCGYLRLLHFGYRGDQTRIIQHYSNLMNRVCINAQNEYGTGVTSWFIQTLRTIILNNRSNWESSPLSSINSHMIYRNSSSNNTASGMNTRRQLIHEALSSGDEEFEDAQSEVRSGHVCSHHHRRQQNNSLLASEWRNIVPADWVSIIEEDVKRQLAQQSLEDEPYSEAYMAGRPSKKRKITEDSETDS